MREFPSYKLDDVFRMGYHEVYRLWTIADELKARDQHQFAVVLDLPHANEERRNEVLSWLKSRQIRQYNDKDKIPAELLRELQDVFWGRE